MAQATQIGNPAPTIIVTREPASKMWILWVIVGLLVVGGAMALLYQLYKAISSVMFVIILLAFLAIVGVVFWFVSASNE